MLGNYPVLDPSYLLLSPCQHRCVILGASYYKPLVSVSFSVIGSGVTTGVAPINKLCKDVVTDMSVSWEFLRCHGASPKRLREPFESGDDVAGEAASLAFCFLCCA